MKNEDLHPAFLDTILITYDFVSSSLMPSDVLIKNMVAITNLATLAVTTTICV
jgi:hypothetical protein